MNARTPPPRGLGWTATWPARALATFLAVISLVVSLYVGYRYVALVDCLRAGAVADQRRTAAIADATDAERAADLALLAGPTPGGPDGAELRRVDIAARQHTDAVRAANPPSVVVPCT